MRIRNLFRALGGVSKNDSTKSPKPHLPQPKALKRSVKILLVDDCREVLDHIEACLLRSFANVRIVKFADGEQAWQELVREEPDYLISDLIRPGVDGRELLRRLAQRQVKFPVLIVSGALAGREQEVRRCAGPELKASFLSKPFDVAEFISIVDRDLSVEIDAKAADKAPASFPATRPLRIIHVDDEDAVLQVVGVIMQRRLKHLELIQFQGSVAAWQFLSRFNPDLLITDDRMPTLSGRDIVGMLAERGATFPILVISALGKTEEWVKEYASRGLRISFLSAPYDISTLFAHMARHLGPLEPPPAKPNG